jgi:hypothetical protein
MPNERLKNLKESAMKELIGFMVYSPADDAYLPQYTDFTRSGVAELVLQDAVREGFKGSAKVRPVFAA